MIIFSLQYNIKSICSNDLSKKELLSRIEKFEHEVLEKAKFINQTPLIQEAITKKLPIIKRLKEFMSSQNANSEEGIKILEKGRNMLKELEDQMKEIEDNIIKIEVKELKNNNNSKGGWGIWIAILGIGTLIIGYVIYKYFLSNE